MPENPGVTKCLEGGGVVVFPADTVYGLACDPENKEAVSKLYRLKQRSYDKPSAIMLFQVEPALELVANLDKRVVGAARKLLPGPVTLILPNPSHLFPLACGSNPETIGLRLPVLVERAQQLADIDFPVLQSSANLSGTPDARSIDDVPGQILEKVDLAVDAGTLPGTPSTVIDLVKYGPEGTYRIVREGALPAAEVDRAFSDSD